MRTLIVIAIACLTSCSSPSKTLHPDPSDVSVEVEGQEARLPLRATIDVLETADGRVCHDLRDRAISIPDGRRVTHVCGGDDASDAEEAVIGGLRRNAAGQWVSDIAPLDVGADGFEFGTIEAHLVRVGRIRLGNGMMCVRIDEDVFLAVGGRAVSFACDDGEGESELVLVGEMLRIDGRLAIMLVDMVSAGDAHEVRESVMLNLGED